MMLLRQVLLFLSRRRDLEEVLRRHPATTRACQRFIAGQGRAEALECAQRLLDQGYRVCLTCLGEDAAVPEEARRAAEEYAGLVGEAAELEKEVEFSLRLSQLGARCDQELCRRLLMSLAEQASGAGRRLRVDAESADLADYILDSVREVHGRWGNVGTVVPAQLGRSSADLDRLNDQGIPVRLVKGSSLESEPEAFSDQEQVTLYFMRLVEALMRDGKRPAIGTHDEKLVEFAVDMAFIFSRDREEFEFHLLHGVNRPLQERLLAQGYRVRVYLPYGNDWYGYFLRRLADRPAELWRLLRQKET